MTEEEEEEDRRQYTEERRSYTKQEAAEGARSPTIQRGRAELYTSRSDRAGMIGDNTESGSREEGRRVGAREGGGG